MRRYCLVSHGAKDHDWGHASLGFEEASFPIPTYGEERAMPIYEFICDDCGHRFSKLFRTMHSAAEGPTPPCEACKSANTRRAVSHFAIQGSTGSDHGEIAAQRAADDGLASITPKEQIDRWRRQAKH